MTCGFLVSELWRKFCKLNTFSNQKTIWSRIPLWTGPPLKSQWISLFKYRVTHKGWEFRVGFLANKTFRKNCEHFRSYFANFSAKWNIVKIFSRKFIRKNLRHFILNILLFLMNFRQKVQSKKNSVFFREIFALFFRIIFALFFSEIFAFFTKKTEAKFRQKAKVFAYLSIERNAFFSRKMQNFSETIFVSRWKTLLQRPLYEIYSVCFRTFTIPCHCKLFCFFVKSLNKNI